MPATTEIDLYNKSERLLQIHYNALILPETVIKELGGNRQAYRIWRTKDPIQIGLRDEFLSATFEVLEGAVITDYFRTELAFGYCRDKWGSWFNNKAEVDSEVETTYGILLPKPRFGVFDGTLGPLAEARYLVQEVPWKRTVRAFMAVDPDEWQRHATAVGTPIEAVGERLKAQLSVKSKSELPITTPEV